MDNASNNDTLMLHLERELRCWNIPFDREKQRIRYVACSSNQNKSHSSRCFPHITNLAIQAVLKLITDVHRAAETAPNYDPAGAFADPDPIAMTRFLVRVGRH